MNARRWIARLACIAILGGSIALFSWGRSPIAHVSTTQPVTPDLLEDPPLRVFFFYSPPLEGKKQEKDPTLNRELILEWPEKLRTGGANLILLTLDTQKLLQLTPAIEEQTVLSEALTLPAWDDAFDAFLDARLDIAGLEISPQATQSQTLLEDEPVVSRWSVLVAETGTYRGAVTLTARFVRKGTDEVTEREISSQILEVNTVSFMGIGGGPSNTPSFEIAELAGSASASG